MEVTNKQRIEYLGTTAQVLAKLTGDAKVAAENFSEVAKKMNVASSYKILNLIGQLASNTSYTSANIIKTSIEAIQVIGKTNFNGGEFETLVKSSCATMEELIPNAYEYAAVPESADGNEDLSAGVVAIMEESLQSYSKLNREALLEVSAAASKVRGDDHALVVNIGKTVETLTNNIITTNNKVAEQVTAMVAEHKLILASIDDITNGLVGKVETVGNADVSTGSMSV